MRKHFIVISLMVVLCGLVKPSSIIQSFRLQQVKLLPGDFKDAEMTDLKYIMSLNPDRLLAPFLREAGLKPKAESYTNWENTGLDGHICGHYLSALSQMYASTGNKAVLNRLNYMLGELERCQNANGDGYIGGVPGSKELWKEVAAGDLKVGNFDVNKKWVPLYNIHKTYAGLRDAWLNVGSAKAKKMLIRFTDWMLNETSKLSDSQIQTLLRSEHGGLNEVFADVAEITGDKKYLVLAYRFSHKTILESLEKSKDELNGKHANTQIPKVIGFERIAQIANDTAYGHAARFFWETVVGHRTCAIGGNSVREHFHPSADFSSMISSEQGPETCNTYNMLKLTKMLYLAEGSEHYIDYYERALYNHILSTQHPDKGGFVYFTPMRPGHYRVYSQPQTSMWCCVGAGMENHSKYNELIYAHNDNDLYVNLFIPSKLTWKEKGLTVTQQTKFPLEESSHLVIGMKGSRKFTINIRYPVWIAPHAIKIIINGVNQAVNCQPGSYITIERKWKNGDLIKIDLPMQTTMERMPDGSNYLAVLHGPIVLAAKTDTTNMKGLFADDSRGGHIASGSQYPLEQMPMFVSANSDLASYVKPVSGKPLVFTASELIYQDKYKNLELIPFYKLHDSRYMIYWETETPEKIKEIQQKLANEELARQKLELQTIDLIVCGEQQPESDHFVESENSTTGVYNNMHFREAKGWFSYKMKDTDRQGDNVQITYWGKDKNRSFRILVNNQLIANVILDGSNGNNFYTMDYAIPADIINKSSGVIVIKFEAEKESVAGGVYKIRLLKK